MLAVFLRLSIIEHDSYYLPQEVKLLKYIIRFAYIKYITRRPERSMSAHGRIETSLTHACRVFSLQRCIRALLIVG